MDEVDRSAGASRVRQHKLYPPRRAPAHAAHGLQVGGGVARPTVYHSASTLPSQYANCFRDNVSYILVKVNKPKQREQTCLFVPHSHRRGHPPAAAAVAAAAAAAPASASAAAALLLLLLLLLLAVAVLTTLQE